MIGGGFSPHATLSAYLMTLGEEDTRCLTPCGMLPVQAIILGLMTLLLITGTLLALLWFNMD